jgi:class 3 adenylate cyclase
MPKPDRRLVPIVSLDVVGYSRLVQHSESQTLRMVQTIYSTLVDKTIAAAGGKVFKTMGDGLLAEFNSVVAAVEWTANLQNTLNQRRIKAPGGGFLQARAGITLADVLVSGDDLFGDGVNLAVRVQGQAPPGGIAITKWMYEYLGGRVELDFTDIGPRELKNIPKTVRIYVWHPEQTIERKVEAPRPALPSTA